MASPHRKQFRTKLEFSGRALRIGILDGQVLRCWNLWFKGFHSLCFCSSITPPNPHPQPRSHLQLSASRQESPDCAEATDPGPKPAVHWLGTL